MSDPASAAYGIAGRSAPRRLAAWPPKRVRPATLAEVMREGVDPWSIWNSVKEDRAFRLTDRQKSQTLSKFYQLKSLLSASNAPKTKVKIYIRRRDSETSIDLPKRFQAYSDNMELYGKGPRSINRSNEKSSGQKDLRGPENQETDSEKEPPFVKPS